MDVADEYKEGGGEEESSCAKGLCARGSGKGLSFFFVSAAPAAATEAEEEEEEEGATDEPDKGEESKPSFSSMALFLCSLPIGVRNLLFAPLLFLRAGERREGEEEEESKDLSAASTTCRLRAAATARCKGDSTDATDATLLRACA